eukprot:scaffold46348_cov15-Tisochrysis_lutea.AAC.1
MSALLPSPMHNIQASTTKITLPEFGQPYVRVPGGPQQLFGLPEAGSFSQTGHRCLPQYQPSNPLNTLFFTLRSSTARVSLAGRSSSSVSVSQRLHTCSYMSMLLRSSWLSNASTAASALSLKEAFKGAVSTRSRPVHTCGSHGTKANQLLALPFHSGKLSRVECPPAEGLSKPVSNTTQTNAIPGLISEIQHTFGDCRFTQNKTEGRHLKCRSVLWEHSHPHLH